MTLSLGTDFQMMALEVEAFYDSWLLEVQNLLLVDTIPFQVYVYGGLCYVSKQILGQWLSKLRRFVIHNDQDLLCGCSCSSFWLAMSLKEGSLLKSKLGSKIKIEYSVTLGVWVLGNAELWFF
jgi:hypothetical protein